MIQKRLGMAPGVWKLSSVLDPRFNGTGTSERISVFQLPGEAYAWIDQKQQALGAPVPSDLYYSCYKG